MPSYKINIKNIVVGGLITLNEMICNAKPATTNGQGEN